MEKGAEWLVHDLHRALDDDEHPLADLTSLFGGREVRASLFCVENHAKTPPNPEGEK